MGPIDCSCKVARAQMAAACIMLSPRKLCVATVYLLPSNTQEILRNFRSQDSSSAMASEVDTLGCILFHKNGSYRCSQDAGRPSKNQLGLSCGFHLSHASASQLSLGFTSQLCS